MSTIVWALVITVYGMYGIPASVTVEFTDETACEKARSSVSKQATNFRDVKTRCEPRKQGIQP